MSEMHGGSCLCGGVVYAVAGPLRDALVCHCRMCQKTHGVPGSYTAAARGDFRLLTESTLRWYASSEIARRGFCQQCGASLFWDRPASDYIAIACGTLDPGSGVKTAGHIFVASQGDYYAIHDALPRFEAGSGGSIDGAATDA